jgi:hypothetical protein
MAWMLDESSWRSLVGERGGEPTRSPMEARVVRSERVCAPSRLRHGPQPLRPEVDGDCPRGGAPLTLAGCFEPFFAFSFGTQVW